MFLGCPLQHLKSKHYHCGMTHSEINHPMIWRFPSWISNQLFCKSQCLWLILNWYKTYISNSPEFYFILLMLHNIFQWKGFREEKWDRSWKLFSIPLCISVHFYSLLSFCCVWDRLHCISAVSDDQEHSIHHSCLVVLAWRIEIQ